MEKSTHTKEYAFLLTELRTARETAGFSQRELAVRLQVPHSWVAKVEMGERRIDLVEFCWFISACGVEPVPVIERLVGQIRARQLKNRPNVKGGRAK
jgi:transcriptional regulator with XRE-family HTH domain